MTQKKNKNDCSPGRPDFAMDGNVVLHRRYAQNRDAGSARLLLQSEPPHWFLGDANAAEVFLDVDGTRSMDELVQRYALRTNLPLRKSWFHVQTVLLELLEKGLVHSAECDPFDYNGRAAELEISGLSELWLHTNQNCNLSCSHCLVQSGPDGDRGADTETLKGWIDQGFELGVRRFFFTGGEPFARADILDLIHYCTVDKESELIIITNGTLFSTRILDGLSDVPRDRLRLQVSLDGCSPAINDAIRGLGSFAKVEAALPLLAEKGFTTALTFVPLARNVAEMGQLPELASRLKVSSVHLMWPHRRGWMVDANASETIPAPHSLVETVLKLVDDCEAAGIDLDNYGAILYRLNGQPELIYDLANAGWDSLFIDHKGAVYPTAVFAGEADLLCGSLEERSLEQIWRDSTVLRKVREFSSKDFAWQKNEPLRWLLGGGDFEQIWYAAGGSFANDVPDPWYPIYKALADRALAALADYGQSGFADASGFDGPRVLHVMGDGAVNCGTEGYQDGGTTSVRTLHSNCVLSFDVDKPRLLVREFYGAAAVDPQADLCCPVRYDDALVGHIPQDVIDRFYGCGSPVGDAGLKPGDRYLDLGSGAGIDVFIAARIVGSMGTATGVDMTDQMLIVAHENQPLVADKLGYNNIEFKQGYLESIPVDDSSVDVITSNCVVNLSPDKRKVFAEMWRVLDSGGRFCISDIVSEKRVPPHLRVNAHLWGECLSGALTERELYLSFIKAGFYGIQINRRSFWKEVEGFRFNSVTVTGYKIHKSEGCQYAGQRAIYQGPFASVTDEEGHVFPRGETVEICTDTADKLNNPPYKSLFAVFANGSESDYQSCCSTDQEEDETCCSPSSGCC